MARVKSIGRWYRAWRGSARGPRVSSQESAPALRTAPHADPRDDQRRSLPCHRLNPEQLRATLMDLENRSPGMLAPPAALDRKRDEDAAGEVTYRRLEPGSQ